MNGHYEKEHHGKKWREARWEHQGDNYVLVDGDWIDADVRPTAAPPAMREEKFEARPGFVFVRGRWDWRNGNWEWMAGHWEKERPGKRWREARWEMRDGSYQLVDGAWDEAPMYPNAAPPPPREERFDARPGHVWVKGRWDWRNGEWTWVPGHMERQRAGNMWHDGRWEMKDGRYAWVEGSWGAPPAYPPLDQPPPEPRAERPQSRPGYFWAEGHWDWKDGQYVWAPGSLIAVRPGYRMLFGKWHQDGDHWIRSNNGWGPADASPPPPQYVQPAPPAPREESVQPKAGFVWARGHYGWTNNAYAWIPGHWERQRASHRWVDGRWEQRGNAWFWVEGGWQ
jgi:hypothetical protein